MEVVTYPTLEHVAMHGRPYPVDGLVGCETGLCLFAAAFLGHNDAIHFAEAGMHGYCVDIDGVRLAEMATLYPGSWQWAVDDAWLFAADAKRLKQSWDVVSVDTFTGAATERSMASLDLWCSIADRMVTATVTEGASFHIPSEWNATHYPRSSDVYWLVLTREI